MKSGSRTCSRGWIEGYRDAASYLSIFSSSTLRASCLLCSLMNPTLVARVRVPVACGQCRCQDCRCREYLYFPSDNEAYDGSLNAPIFTF